MIGIKPEFSVWFSERAAHIQRLLELEMPSKNVTPMRLHDAMRYAVLGGGKRVRAALVYAAGFGCLPFTQNAPVVNPDQMRALDCAAASVELIHAYSLVHDDLPSMDNDDLRRGQPTLHVRFDEPTALLAGDALQPLAFDFLAKMPIEAERVVQAFKVLSQAAGSFGMAGGQAIDLASVGLNLTQSELQHMHRLKTGALLTASSALGGLAVDASAQQQQALTQYSLAMGLAFQVIDDVLDVTADRATLGKTPGKDVASNKPTYVALMGLSSAQDLTKELHREAIDAIASLGESGRYLHGLADFIVFRDH